MIIKTKTRSQGGHQAITSCSETPSLLALSATSYYLKGLVARQLVITITIVALSV